MNFGEFFVYLMWFGLPTLIFESLRGRYLFKRHKQLMQKVNSFSIKEYETEGTRLKRKGNLFRIAWILWIMFWTIELTFF